MGHKNGLGISVDLKKAREYYEQAHAAGCAYATGSLGQMYQDGLGVPQDSSRARQYYEQAHAAGNLNATNSLGAMYMHGKGVPENLQLARRYFELAHAGGNVDATSTLALMHMEGMGSPVDLQKAREYYEQARAAGSANARLLGLLKKHLDQKIVQEIVVDSRVEVTGLVNKAERNGQLGTALKYFDAKGRWAVRMDIDGKEILVKAANLKRVHV